MSIKDREEEFKLRFKAISEAVQKWEMETFGQCGFVKPKYYGYQSYEIRSGASPMSGAVGKSYSSSRTKEYYLYGLSIDENNYWSTEDDGYPVDVSKKIEGCMDVIRSKYTPVIQKMIAKQAPPVQPTPECD